VGVGVCVCVCVCVEGEQCVGGTATISADPELVRQQSCGKKKYMK